MTNRAYLVNQCYRQVLNPLRTTLSPLNNYRTDHEKLDGYRVVFNEENREHQQASRKTININKQAEKP